MLRQSSLVPHGIKEPLVCSSTPQNSKLEQAHASGKNVDELAWKQAVSSKSVRRCAEAMTAPRLRQRVIHVSTTHESEALV